MNRIKKKEEKRDSALSLEMNEEAIGNMCRFIFRDA